MRRLRPLSEAECYARCYGGWDDTVRIVRLEPRRARPELALEGEALRVRFEEFLDARDPLDLAEPDPLSECAAIRLLADESDPRRLQLHCDPFESVRRARKVDLAQIAGSRCRSSGSIRHADAVGQKLELLCRFQQARREPRSVKKPPEVVARIREVGLCRRGDTAGIDPAEEHPETRSEDVRYC
jgi:hypothetical protein